MKTYNEYVDTVIARIRQGWIKGLYAADCLGLRVWTGDANAVCWCLSGAMKRECVSFPTDISDKLHYKLLRVVKPLGYDNYSKWNDAQTSVEPVIALLESCKE